MPKARSRSSVAFLTLIDAGVVLAGLRDNAK
jgi:hypothetical protein